MKLARLADKIFAFFFDCLRQPGSADFRLGAIVQNRVFLDRHLLGELVTFLGPTLELLLGALTIAKQCVPRVRRTLVVAFIDFEKGIDELVGV